MFQIATEVETSIIELAGMVQQPLGQDVAMRRGPPRQGDIRKNYSATAKVRKVLGWQPEIDLRDGLRETGAWFKSQWLGF